MEEREYIIKLLFDLIDGGNINEEKLKNFYEKNKLINKVEYEKSLEYLLKKEGRKNAKRN